jgi:hypothetical protein
MRTFSFLIGLACYLGHGVACKGAYVDLPLPDIKGAGIAKFAVFDGAAKDDTLLWRSAADADKNQFRVWSLNSGTFYGVTFGKTDDAPGQLVAFCGYEAGRNNGMYDIAAGKLLFKNSEPPKMEDLAGTVLDLPTGKVTVKKGMASIKSVQGEFVDPNKLEFFNFAFDKTSANGPAMTHDLFMGGPEKGHPANYNANKVDLTQALTPALMFAAFQNGTHVWNPQKVTTTLIDFPDKWEFDTAAPSEQDVEEYISTTQPAAVPEPATWILLLGAGFFMLATRIRVGILATN